MKCPCYSGKEYKECCAPYHQGKLLPPDPLSLMRSRYSAYALGNVHYILATTHPNHSDQAQSLTKRKQQLKLFSRNTKFTGLEILEATATTVTFTAHLLQKGKDLSFTEKSEFSQVEGKWYYLRPLQLQQATDQLSSED